MPNRSQDNLFSKADFRVALFFLFTQLVLASGQGSYRRHHNSTNSSNATLLQGGRDSNFVLDVPFTLSVIGGTVISASLLYCCLSYFRNLGIGEDDEHEGRMINELHINESQRNPMPEKPEIFTIYETVNCLNISSEEPIALEIIDRCIKKASNPKEELILIVYGVLLRKLSTPICVVSLEEGLLKGFVVYKESSDNVAKDYVIEIYKDLETLNAVIQGQRGLFPTARVPILHSETKVYNFEINNGIPTCSLLSTLKKQCEPIIKKLEKRPFLPFLQNLFCPKRSGNNVNNQKVQNLDSNNLPEEDDTSRMIYRS